MGSQVRKGKGNEKIRAKKRTVCASVAQTVLMSTKQFVPGALDYELLSRENVNNAICRSELHAFG